VSLPLPRFRVLAQDFFAQDLCRCHFADIPSCLKRLNLSVCSWVSRLSRGVDLSSGVAGLAG
jgi:hypothetical protein